MLVLRFDKTVSDLFLLSIGYVTIVKIFKKLLDLDDYKKLCGFY